MRPVMFCKHQQNFIIIAVVGNHLKGSHVIILHLDELLDEYPVVLTVSDLVPLNFQPLSIANHALSHSCHVRVAREGSGFLRYEQTLYN